MIFFSFKNIFTDLYKNTKEIEICEVLASFEHGTTLKQLVCVCLCFLSFYHYLQFFFCSDIFYLFSDIPYCTHLKKNMWLLLYFKVGNKLYKVFDPYVAIPKLLRIQILQCNEPARMHQSLYP